VTSTIYGNKTWSFHLERVSNDRFVLKSKKDHIKLAKALLGWYDSNEKLREQEYTEVLSYMKSNPYPLTQRTKHFHESAADQLRKRQQLIW
jgi:hypothetical protein